MQFPLPVEQYLAAECHRALVEIYIECGREYAPSQYIRPEHNELIPLVSRKGFGPPVRNCLAILIDNSPLVVVIDRSAAG